MKTTNDRDLKATEKKLNLKKDTLRQLGATPSQQNPAITLGCTAHCSGDVCSGTGHICC
jgi:hypothetical protein